MSGETVAIIGAGNLGRRHLQGVLKVERPLVVWVIDPSQASLDMSRQMAEESTLGHAQTHVFYTQNLNDIPSEPDAVIVATSANVRLKVLMALYDACRPKAVLLEKILFQSLSEFDKAAHLFGKDADRVWVNTARRVMQAHHQIKSFFRDTPITALTANGGLWGLGTSLIHLIDLLDFYQPGPLHSISTEALDGEILHSKRPGFREITGTFSGHLGAARFSFTSSPDSTAPLRFFVEAPDRFCVIEESAGRVVFAYPESSVGVEEKRMHFDYISDTTTVVLTAILTDQPINLPNFATSAALHRPLLSALGPFFAARLGTPETLVPLT